MQDRKNFFYLGLSASIHRHLPKILDDAQIRPLVSVVHSLQTLDEAVSDLTEHVGESYDAERLRYITDILAC